MAPSKGNILLPYSRSQFLAATAPAPAQVNYAPRCLPQTGGGTLDLTKVMAYFAGPGRGTYAHHTFQGIRAKFANDHFWQPPILENAVAAIFEEYCRYLQGVTYVHNTSASPFQLLFTGNQSNCIGRATGFLQLLAIASLPADKLFHYKIGNVPGIKICEKTLARQTQPITNYGQQLGIVPPSAPNAIQVHYVGGALTVSRTPREPFDNHDATFIDISTFSRQCWDPLLMMSYNEFSDCVDTYEEVTDAALFNNARWAKLRALGLRCYISEEFGRGGDRIYYLPPRASLVNATQSPHLAPNVLAQPALTQAYIDLATLDTAQRLAVIFDQENWDYRKYSHPPALLDMFTFT